MSPEKEKSSPGTLRDRERERLRISLAREAVERRAARVAEPEQPGALVEGLARGVVERRADHAVARAARHVEQQRVPAAREQREERRLERLGLEVERRDVRVQVVDRDERQARSDQASAFAAETPTSSAPISPGPRVTATASTSASVASASASASATTGANELEVPARGDLGHDPAVARVQVGLRGDDVREHLALAR